MCTIVKKRSLTRSHSLVVRVVARPWLYYVLLLCCAAAVPACVCMPRALSLSLSSPSALVQQRCSRRALAFSLLLASIVGTGATRTKDLRYTLTVRDGQRSLLVSFSSSLTLACTRDSRLEPRGRLPLLHFFTCIFNPYYPVEGTIAAAAAAAAVVIVAQTFSLSKWDLLRKVKADGNDQIWMAAASMQLYQKIDAKLYDYNRGSMYFSFLLINENYAIFTLLNADYK